MKGQTMIQKIKSSLFVLATLLMTGLPALVPVAVSADNISGSLCAGTKLATGAGTSDAPDATCGTDATGGTAGIYNLAKKIVNIFSVIVGIIAVLMIIYGGFKYITSGGDSGNVSGAKNTLIYAIVGLVIVALAQFIVRFVLNTANGVSGNGG